MRALLLDPTAGTVTEVDYDGDYRSIYKLIDCETFTTVGLDDKGNTLFVDDEGLFRSMDSGEFEPFIIWRGYNQPLAGKGLILGTNEEGDSIATTLSLDYVTERVSFKEMRCLNIETVEGKTEMFGKQATYIQQVPVFEEKRP